ncbi:hypothetical protein GCM10028819_29500 [Spirosoma humi]
MAKPVPATNGTVDNATNETAMADHAMADSVTVLKTNVIIAMANHVMASNVIRTTARTAMNDRRHRAQRRPLSLHQTTGQSGAKGRITNALNNSAKVSQRPTPALPRTGNAMIIKPIEIARQPTTGTASVIQA